VTFLHERGREKRGDVLAEVVFLLGSAGRRGEMSDTTFNSRHKRKGKDAFHGPSLGAGKQSRSLPGWESHICVGKKEGLPSDRKGRKKKILEEMC